MDKTVERQSFGKHIRSLRETKGKLLRQAAADLDVDQAVLSKLENGLLLPSEAIIEKLAAYYKTGIDELRVQAYAEKIVGEVGEFKHAEKVISLVKEHLASYVGAEKQGKKKSKKEK
ncbi:MAG: helix-turn-helix transcriptional regulator [Ignavibacteriales bacterium]|nr:helix-turn-helix transcriptional regulator [Ignavibacteriales bacterium]